MSKHNQLIMAVQYPIVSKDNVKFVRGFKALANGGLEPLFTDSPERAQRFGPEGQLHVNWLSGRPVELDEFKAYSLIKAPETPTQLFDDGKDYTTVEVATIVTSNESHLLYKQIKEAGMDYKQDMGGNLITIGVLAGGDVCIAPMIQTIDGVRVAYVEATSEVVDFTMVENWIMAKCTGIKSITEPGRVVNEVALIKRCRTETV
ncbi:hypothetical protein PHABIO_32 [Pseudomonas phage Phabio]|uniref:Uncharacterized protein n=1 Tax=Pseudomonas phage Phabio TaxID=2006668 RepID=A0A1Y0SY42_9CAUD|nr:hypothetical protein MZD05_gp032 [Pseudomonas phage Phabio]ARV76663.1 hypothetical protein PHABIO_32 [Pseudomonas phage Phabio]